MFILAIFPTSLHYALALSSPSIFLSRLPLVSPDSLLCLSSPQVSNTSSEQWSIVLYWAALISLLLPLLLPSIYMLWSFFLSAHSFPFHCLPTSWRSGGWNGKNGLKKQQRKRMSEGCRVCMKRWRREREKKVEKLAKEDRSWKETWNNGKWRTARWLLENGGLDRE